MDTKIQVEIYGQTYQIRAGADSEYIKTIARYVDIKMREIASGTPTVDSLKIAVLAALNITDEFFQLKRQKQDVDREMERRAEKLNEILDSIWTTDEQSETQIIISPKLWVSMSICGFIWSHVNQWLPC